jgi:hypothetical protein
MSIRPSALFFVSLISLTILSGCPTRSASEEAEPDASSTNDGAAPPDAGDDLGTTNVLVTSGDAGESPDGAGGATAVDEIPEQPKLPAPVGLPVGTTCTVNSDCGTGSCVDGVCCSSAACGTCQSCAVAGALGTCSPLPAQTEDPRSSCVGTMACDGAGRCASFNGNTCAGGADCISGFCVDGVCCESSCDQTCYSCNTVLQLRGQCVPLAGGVDPAAASPCAGNRNCTANPTPEQPLCLLVDGQPCTAASDCVNGQCSTFYADRDGDKYGNSASTVSICAAPDAPPAGYVAIAGDCCDADGNAHPKQVSTFAHVDSCGSWDYDCDGYVEKQFTTGPCGGYSGNAPSDCGKACVRVVLGSPITTYTQACR